MHRAVNRGPGRSKDPADGKGHVVVLREAGRATSAVSQNDLIAQLVAQLAGHFRAQYHIKQAVKGFPIKVVAPCEGTGYEIGSMSIIKGGRNTENAQKFYDWALSADVQSRALEVNAFQVPSNKGAETSPSAPDLASIKLIDYDFGLYGSSAERKRLLAKWDDEVKSLPR